MARVFAVTSSIDRIAPDSEGRCRVTFTVTNTGPEALTARLSVVPRAPAEAAWFQPLERPERRLEPEATEQIAVELRIPPGAAAGDYSFRLDAVSEENPVEGPSVGFEVKASAGPRKKAALKWGRILLSAVLAAVAALAILWLSLTLFFNLTPDTAIDKLCDLSEANDFGEALGPLFACLVQLGCVAAILYFPVALVLSVLLIRRLVAERRRLHALLAALLSVPMALALLWLLGAILDS